MRVDRREALVLFGATTVASATPAFAQSDPGAKLRALLDQSAMADALLDPLSGDAEPAPAAPPFVDPLSDAYVRTLESNKRRELAALATIDRNALDAVDRIAFDVFDYKTRETLAFIGSGLFDIQRQVNFDPSFGIHVEFADLMASKSFATVTDYERGLAMLDGFADTMASAVREGRRGLASGHIQPRVLIDKVIAQVDAMLALPVEKTPFYVPVTKIPEAIGAADRTQLGQKYRRMIAERILPAYRTWQTFLRDEYRPRALEAPGRWAMADGERLYAAELARHTTTRLSADAVHVLGLSEVARIRGEMEQVRAKVGFAGALPAFFDYVRTDPKFYFTKPQDLLARFADIQRRIWIGIPKLFAERPKAPFEVRALPALGEQRGTGYYKAGPPDGSSPGILYFNMAMLPTRPIPTMETLTLHEGIPGHHFQINLAREDLSLPPLLRFGTFTAYTEGWGLYAESLGRELDLFTDPMQWFGHLDMEMLRAVRLVVDTGLHAKRWSRERAIDYMLANTSMARRDVEVEIDRYIAAPAQACAYKVGELKLHELRGRAEKALGARFDIRAFHHQILSTGSIPLAVLESKIDSWIGSPRRRA